MLASIGSQNSEHPSSSTKETTEFMFASPRNSTPSSSPMKKAKSSKPAKPAKPYAAKPSTKKIGTYSAKTQAIKRLMKIDKMK